ncbi:PAS-domain containing protein [Undibacterium sp. RTI2.1]|uniref:PAS-domain containing protein n=1 Tax=unclassified Undibacterium TaxID=2630295 RepID=UPI002B22BE99|nr:MULTISPECIES: PAS-domain containing protein [unclassified Undibacterium]MEB0029589.1 PAS-domain containing protein [Undibacterium sp. RTI2.1]MEB0116060.1 PAS-domain containing protein [Undibacterium sp. RTI2.2]
MTPDNNSGGQMFGAASVSKEAIYHAMVEQSLDGLIVMENNQLVDCNPSAERLYGATRAQLMFKSPVDFSAPYQADGRDSPSAAEFYVRLAVAGYPQRFEWIARKLDGTLFPTELCISRLIDGDIIRIIIVVRDLTERQRTEQESLRRSRQLQILLDNFPGGVSLMDDSGYLVAWNQTMVNILDLPPALIEQRMPHIQEILRFNIARGEFSEFGNNDAQRFQYILGLLERKTPFSYERTRSDGSILEVRSSPISSGGFVTTCVDITAKRSIQSEYKRQSLLLQTILSNMPQGISVFDQDLRLQTWNQGFLDILDYDPASIYRGVHFADLLRIMAERGEYGDGNIDDLIQQRLALAMRFEAHQFERARPNGHTHLVQGNPIYEDINVDIHEDKSENKNDGNADRNPGQKLSGFITTYTDITNLKAAELALSKANALLEQNVADRTSELRIALNDLIRSEKLAALGSLVAGVAHELNTPIGNSLLISSTLKERTTEFTALLEQGQIKRSLLINYLQEAEQASALLERGLSSAAELIRSFKQVAVDQASSKRRPFNLKKISQDILATVIIKIQQAGIQMQLDIADDIEMDSYPGPLEQVISNLIDNAILHGFEQFTNPESGTMHLSAKRLDQETLEIRFQDNGIGIPDEDLSRIFDPFFTTKLGRGGSGLGLNIVYNIVTSLLGGKISVESHYGQGACFILHLPLVAPTEDTKHSKE